MRSVVVGLSVALLSVPALGSAQTSKRVVVQAAAGPTLYDRGTNVSGSIGFAPSSRFTLLLNVDRTNVPTRTRTYVDGYGVSRGWTMTTVSGELRFALLPSHRVSPYLSIGSGSGKWRQEPHEWSPDPPNRSARFMSGGAGVTVPVGNHLMLFGDARIMLGIVGSNGMLGAAPVRAGLSLRF